MFLRLVARILCAAFLAAPIAAQAPFKVPEIPVERYTLPNGLTVLLSRDTTAPVIAVDVWYHVGSKNEKVGRTGFAHLFEHVMFQGSAHIPYGVHIKTIENAGGEMNGSTAEDRTNYFETLPSNQLETALWLESDRMGYLLPALDQAKLDAQRAVVKNERRQRVDNQPFGSAGEVIRAALYPAANSYSWPVIGSMADLSAATLDDVKDFFRTYYAPNNATLAVVGDFDVAKTKAMIVHYFGAIPSGPTVTRPTFAPVTLASEKRLVLEDQKAQQPNFVVVWPTVGEDQADETPLSVLGNVLTQDRTSRLTKLLVYDRQLATRVGAGQSSKENAGDFSIQVIPRPGVSLTEIERLIDSTLAALVTTNPPTTAEVDRFKNYERVNTVLGLDGAMNRAEILLDGQAYHGDPLHYVKSTNASLAVTADEVARVAKKYLTTGRLVLSMVPAGKTNLAAKFDAPYTNVTPAPEKQEAAEAAPPAAPSAGAPKVEAAKPPVVPPARALTFPKAQQRTLKNGITVTILEDHKSPVVSVSTVVRISSLADPAGKTGIGGFVTALMSEGTTKHTAEQLTDAFAALGNRVTPTGFYTIPANLDKSLDLMAEQFLLPAFPQTSLDRIKANQVAQLQRAKENPQFIAGRILSTRLYGTTHPYARAVTPEDVKSISRDDIVAYYQAYYRPPNIKIVVAGDITPAQAVVKLNKIFGDLKAGKSGEFVVPPVKPVDSTVVYLYDRPGSPQSIVLAAQLGPRRDTPDRYAIELMNTALGGAFNSRINLNLREEHQYAYGASAGFSFRRPPQPSTFTAGAGVATVKTDSALIELLKEIKQIRDSKPVTPEELAFAKASATKGLPLQFETIDKRAEAVAGLVASGEPLDYYNHLIQRYDAVTLAQAEQAAKTYLTPKNMVIVVVGDRKTVEAGLRAAHLGPVVVVEGALP